MAGLPGLQSSSSNVYDLHLASHNIAKRNNSFKGGRDPKLFQFVQDKFQFPASEYEIRLASSSNSKVWLYFGTLYHHGQPVCDRLYCSPCFENQKIEGISYYLSALMPRIKHYAKSVSTGNLAIHLHDKHNIVIVAPNASPGRPCRSKSRSSMIPKSENGNSGLDSDSAMSTCSNFASLDSSEEFDEDQDASVTAKNMQKMGVDIISRISCTDSLNNLIREFRSLLRLARSNFVCLTKSRSCPEAHHYYLVSLQFVWNMIKSAIVIWRGMPDSTYRTYLNAIDFAYKTVPNDFRNRDEIDQVGHVLILMSGCVKSCDQSSLVLYADQID